MRNNAITRIILWSIVIVLLVGILCSVMFTVSNSRSRIEALYVTVPTERPVILGKVTDNVQVYASPNESATKLSLLSAGTEVTISLQETVDGENWAFLDSPVTGWVQESSIRIRHGYREEAVPLETIVVPAISGTKNTFSASEVQEIEIVWVAGDILIQPHDTDTIVVREDGNFDAKYAMVYSCREGELKIKFCEESLNGIIGLKAMDSISKDLTIYVPRDWVCESLELDVASAKVEVNDMTIQEVDFDGASGTCEFENCTVQELDIDTASGDIRFIGVLEMLDCDAASASVYAVLHNTPSRLDMDTMSGDMDISLPADAGFTLSMDAMNSDFTSDFETSMKNGNYVCGDGRCRINVDGMSGDVAIRKAESMITPAATDAVTSP